MNESRFTRISRRNFLALVAAGAFAILLFCLRRIDISKSIAIFFGFNGDFAKAIRTEVQQLQRADMPLFRKSQLFFGLSRLGAHRVLPKETQNVVLEHWCRALLNRRALSWPYIHYPDVGNTYACNGLIRR